MGYKDFPQNIIERIDSFLSKSDSATKYPDEYAFLLDVKETLVQNGKFSSISQMERCTETLNKVNPRKGPKEPYDDDDGSR